MALSTGFNAGLGLGRLRDSQRRTSQAERANLLARQQEVIKLSQDGIKLNFEAAAKFSENAINAGKPPEEVKARIARIFLPGVRAHVLNAKNAGAPVANAEIIEQQLLSLAARPTPEQLRAQKVEDTKATTTAELEAKEPFRDAPATKEAVDRTSGQTVFVTEEQIQANPERFVPRGGAKDRTDLIKSTSSVAANMLKDGAPIESIRGVLNALSSEASDPEVSDAINSILQTLPASQADFQRTRQEQEIAASQPRVNALVEAGVDRDVAQILALGGTSSIQIDASPTELTPQEKADLRGEINRLSSLSSRLRDVIPLINDDTVGLLSGFSENVGGVGQQIPGVRAIFNTLGAPLNLDEKSVRQVQQARSLFRTLIGPLADFLLQRSQRLSNQQLDLVNQAQRLTEATTDADNAKKVMINFLNLAEREMQTAAQQLQSGSIDTGNVIQSGEGFDIVPDPNDPTGKTFIIQPK